MDIVLILKLNDIFDEAEIIVNSLDMKFKVKCVKTRRKLFKALQDSSIF